MAELYAGYMEYTDAQIGRLIDSLEQTGQLDNTLIFVFVGDNGSSGEGGLEGLFNEQSVTIGGELSVDISAQLKGVNNFNV